MVDVHHAVAGLIVADSAQTGEHGFARNRSRPQLRAKYRSNRSHCGPVGKLINVQVRSAIYRYWALRGRWPSYTIGRQGPRHHEPVYH